MPGLTKAAVEMSEAVTTLFRALADGRIDHTERPAVIRDMREAITEGEALVASLEKEARR